MPEPKAIKEIDSRPLTQEKELCVVNLSIAIAEYEANQIYGYYSDSAFFNFYVFFRRLVTITSHEKVLKDVLYGKTNIQKAIESYFYSDVKKNSEFGTRLARIYLKALFDKGIVSTRDK